jgi:pilus assembly protein FimV
MPEAIKSYIWEIIKDHPMHLRKLVLACGFASFALSNYASALGLGEVKLKSTLNQPLSAEVQLLDTKGLSPEQIIVSLASVSDFERNGLDFTHFYSELKFEVVLDNPSGPVVRITSRNPVREPYLNFLVEAKWTSGRLLREYTLLMDLPTFDEAAPKAAVQSAQASQVNPAETKTTKSSDADIAAEVQAAVDATDSEEKPEIIAEQDQPAKKSNTAADTYGPVGDKDTLWDIALSVRPDSSASVHQTMLALQRLNPDAFIRGNINLLKKGQVLRVPDAAEISSVSKSEAVSQFNAQTSEWSGTSTSSTGMGAQLDASTRSSTERVKSEAVAGRVKLEAPTAKDTSASGQGSGANKGSGKALESELASTLEELDKAKSDKTELSSRVRDLEAQVKTMQRLVDVSNEKLRALQVNSAKQPDKAGLTAKAAAETSAPVASEAATSAASSEVASSAAAVVPKKPVVKRAPVVVEPEKTLADHLLDNILWVGLGAAGILGAAVFAVMRRRKAQAEATQSFDKDSDDLFTSEPNFDAFNQPEESAAEPSADEMALFDEEDTSAVAETGDVVGEADIYIAYGKYDQAEEMLLNGLSKDPASTDIRLKLLEVYSQTQNPVEFDKHYAAILPFATGFALSRAKELRANIPGVGEFSAEAAVAEENLDFNTNFDLDDFDAAPAEAAVASAASDDHFDFDLDLDDDGDLANTPSATEEADLDVPSKANYGMDFSEKVDTSKSTVASLDDEFVLDFELDDTTKNKEAVAEDLSDISLALDGLDDDGLPDDVEVSAREDEFSFDFNDLDADASSLAQEVDSIKSSEFNEDETLGDDFNLEMDVNGLDLAALDNEMASFDAELDSLDDAQDKPAALAGESLAAAEDFNLDDIDDGLAELDAGLQGESLAELDADLDDSDFSWEEAQESEVEPELASALEDEFSLSEEEFALDDEDDFDIDSVAGLDTNTNLDALNLESLDAELTEESLEEQLNLDEEPEIDLDELDVELDKQSFAELEEGLSEAGLDVDDSELDGELDLDESMFDEDLTADESLAESTLSLEDDGHFDEAIEETFSEALPDAATATEEIDALDAVVETDAEAFAESAPLLDSAEEELADDDIFEQALSDFSAESLALDEEANMSDDDMDAELDFMADADEAATKLDLARAYMDMGDNEGARDILAEVAHEGNDQQRQEAVDLLGRIDA